MQKISKLPRFVDKMKKADEEMHKISKLPRFVDKMKKADEEMRNILKHPRFVDKMKKADEEMEQILKRAAEERKRRGRGARGTSDEPGNVIMLIGLVFLMVCFCLVIAAPGEEDPYTGERDASMARSIVNRVSRASGIGGGSQPGGEAANRESRDRNKSVSESSKLFDCNRG